MYDNSVTNERRTLVKQGLAEGIRNLSTGLFTANVDKSLPATIVENYGITAAACALYAMEIERRPSLLVSERGREHHVALLRSVNFTINSFRVRPDGGLVFAC